MAQPAIAQSSPTTLQFIAEFRNLHDKLRSGTISAADRTKYTDTRQQLVRMMVISQIGVTGQTLRSELRMSKMLKLEIRSDNAPALRLTTLEIASRGFAALMPEALPLGTICGFTLHLPKPASPIAGRVVVASSRTQGSLAKTSFRYENLLPGAAEQLDIALIDAVLERLTRF